MKRFVVFAILLFSILAAFVMLTINVDVDDIGGISGTLVVQAGTTKEDIEHTATAFRIAGIFWFFIALICLKSLFNKV